MAIKSKNTQSYLYFFPQNITKSNAIFYFILICEKFNCKLKGLHTFKPSNIHTNTADDID